MCGIFAAWNVENASNTVYMGLYALQHRGQESVGIISRDDEGFHSKKKMRLVSDSIHQTDLDRLSGDAAVGHVRYSTSGGSTPMNIQPISVRLREGPAAIAHNGNLVNTPTLREQLVAGGAIFQSAADTELIFHLMATSDGTTFRDQFRSALSKVRGAYSLLMLTNDHLYLARDENGFRPLLLARYNGGYVAGSETCAFDLIGATDIEEVQPGELIAIDRQGKLERLSIDEQVTGKTSTAARQFCVFEHVYLARPDSTVFGQSVYEVRKRMGRQLAEEYPISADMVIPVPDSGMSAALGYSEASGIPFELGLIRNHYVHRTFIQPHQKIRNFGVRVKLNPQREVLRGKKVVVVDDSIVRGTTSKKIVGMLREAGAAEVHMRVASPPITHPCFFGIDTPNRQELIGSRMTTDEISSYLDVDTLGYLSHAGLLKAVNGTTTSYCVACFTGEYPVAIDEQLMGG